MGSKSEKGRSYPGTRVTMCPKGHSPFNQEGRKLASRRISAASRLSLFKSISPRSRSKGGVDMRLRDEPDKYGQCSSAASGVARR
jgi:hypothetical protein